MDLLIGRNMHGRSPCGERGLKYDEICKDFMKRCRSPCGERGLK